MSESFKVISIDTNQENLSIFSSEIFPRQARGGMLLTDRIDARNFRLRESEAGYTADWHMAGDPTLIIVQAGVLRITLRDGTFREFKAGDTFIAKDNLPEGTDFDPEKHGHCASVTGNETLRAVHIKLG